MRIKLTIIIKIIHNINWENILIICICNAISDKVINKAISDGAQTVWQVYEACQCTPECGSCHDYIKNEINCFYNSSKN